MKINQVNKNNSCFKSIIIPNDIARKKITENLASREIIDLKNILIKQKNNPINAYIGLDKNRLTASLQCEYRLKDFRENYKQWLFFESNLSFIKRIAKKCDEYKTQLKERF